MTQKGSAPVGVRMAVRVQPGAKSNAIVGWTSDAGGGQTLKIRLRAPAVEGKANAALVEFLADTLRLRSRQIVLERGDKSRGKIVFIEGLTLDALKQRLRPE